MNKQQRLSAPKDPERPFPTLHTNLRLLNLDQREDWPQDSIGAFVGKDTPQKQKARIHFVEWVLYNLFCLLDPDECNKKLQPFFPPLEPLQSINLRNAIFRCLSELKKANVLGKDVFLRKSMLDDCRGEQVQELMSALSTAVLLKKLGSDRISGQSIAAKLCLASKIPTRSYDSMLPLAIAHRTSLTNLLKRREAMRARYHCFTEVLSEKDADLNRKFEKIVKNQDFLDQNVPSEATLARVAKVFDQHWQGDRRLIDVIGQGEDSQMTDSLFDRKFTSVWPEVVAGSFDGRTTTSRYGLLEDLEKRVGEQSARLQSWKVFKDQLSQRRQTNDLVAKATENQSNLSPRLKTVSYNSHREKDMVFSPRKSPRKSILPINDPTRSPENLPVQRSQIFDRKISEKLNTNLVSHLDSNKLPKDSINPDTQSRDPKTPYIQQACSSRSLETNGHFRDKNESGRKEQQGGTASKNQLPDLVEPIGAQIQDNAISKTNMLRLNTENERLQGEIHHNDIYGSSDDSRADDAPDPDDVQFAQVPPKPSTARLLFHTKGSDTKEDPAKLSLEARTRKSMAVTTRVASIPEDSATPLPKLQQNSTQRTDPGLEQDSRFSLAERTRQSIALVPPSSGIRRQSSNPRRTSKVYPVNQFATPRKSDVPSKMTPPDEIFSPNAGYDSVFKSRPKIAFSPTSSPTPVPETEQVAQN